MLTTIRAHSGHGVDHGPDDRVILFFRFRHMRGAFTFERGVLNDAEIEPRGNQKTKERETTRRMVGNDSPPF